MTISEATRAIKRLQSQGHDPKSVQEGFRLGLEAAKEILSDVAGIDKQPSTQVQFIQELTSIETGVSQEVKILEN